MVAFSWKQPGTWNMFSACQPIKLKGNENGVEKRSSAYLL